MNKTRTIEDMEFAMDCWMDEQRRYRVIWVANNGSTGVLAPGPLTHSEACTFKSKVTNHSWRRVQLEEIK